MQVTRQCIFSVHHAPATTTTTLMSLSRKSVYAEIELSISEKGWGYQEFYSCFGNCGEQFWKIMKLNGSNRKELNQRRIHGSRTSMQGYVHPAPGTNITRKKPLTRAPHHREHSFLHLKCWGLGGWGGGGGVGGNQRGREEGEGIRALELCEQGGGPWLSFPIPFFPRP